MKEASPLELNQNRVFELDGEKWWELSLGWDREGQLPLVFHRLYGRAEGKPKRERATGLEGLLYL